MRKILLLTFIFAFIAGVYAQERIAGTAKNMTRANSPLSVTDTDRSTTTRADQVESIFGPGNKYSNIPFTRHSGPHASASLFPDGTLAGLTLKGDSVDFVGAWPFGPASAIAVDEENDLAFLGSGGAVYILDISDPNNPVELSNELCTQDFVAGLTYSDDKLYIANYKAGLSIWDVSVPSDPQALGGYVPETPNGAYYYSVFLSGDLAYVADASEGLYIIDISDPSNPIEVGFYEMWAGADDVYVKGDYAYVGSFHFEVVDISDPANPYQVCEVELLEGAIEVDVAGSYAYCAGDEFGLKVINISDPLNAYKVGSCYTSGDAYGVKVQDNFAYVACLNGSMSVVSITSPNNPYLVGFLDLPGWSTELDVTEKFAYVTAGEGGLRVIDIQVPAQPGEVAVFETPDNTYGVFVQGDYAYLANDDGGLRVIGTSDPLNPNEAGHCEISGDVAGVYVSGDYAYLPSADSTLHVIDVSDPSQPIEIGSCFTPCEPFGVFVSGDYAYLGGMYDGLRVIDISTPTDPFEVGFYDTPHYAMSVFVLNNFAYVADSDGGLRVIDISIPANPVEVGACTFDDAQGVFVLGSYAYVASGGEGLVVVDVSNPNSPFIASTYETWWATAVYVTGGHAYVADYSTGLRVIDISTPSNPNEVGYYNTPGGAEGVFCSGAFTFVADGMGLQILQFLGGSLAVSATATPDEVCDGESSQLNGYAGGGSGSYSYSWTSDPPGFTSTEQNPIVTPTETTDYILEVNDGTISIYDTVTVTVFLLPDVTLATFDTVCVGWPAFELTGGLPEGGEYSGTGVADGWFDPEVAGVGTHTITYTYTNINLCENSAEQDIVVDACTGINLPIGISIGVMPNPNTGFFKVFIKSDITEKVNIKVMNNQGVKVFEELNVELTDKYMTEVNLLNYARGIYYLHIQTNDANYIEKIIVK